MKKEITIHQSALPTCSPRVSGCRSMCTHRPSDARVLVDTGMTELHPAAADLDPRLLSLSKQDFDLAGITLSSTHTCTSTTVAATTSSPASRSTSALGSSTTRKQGGLHYSRVGRCARACSTCRSTDEPRYPFPGLRLVQAPGHRDGMQMVVIETGGRPIVVGGDVAVWFGELDEPHTEGQLRVLALDPELVWLTHTDEPWRPRHEA